MGGVLLLLCCSVCFAFSWCCPLRQEVCSFKLWVDPWNLTLLEGGQGHLQQITGLAVQLLVTLETAFLCRGRAEELLQAFVVFPVWKVLEQTRAWACWFNQRPLFYEQCYLFLLFPLMCCVIQNVAFYYLNFSFFLSLFFPLFFFFANCFMVENLQVWNYSDFSQTIDFILTPIRRESNLFLFL